MVCPMRVLLLVVSTALAGYFTWRAWRGVEEAREEKPLLVGTEERKPWREQVSGWLRAFLIFIFDMGSGRYLYSKLAPSKKGAEEIKGEKSQLAAVNQS